MKYNCTICEGRGHTALGPCSYCRGSGLYMVKPKTIETPVKMKKLYISGPMRHRTQEYFDMFNIAKERMARLGYQVSSPLDLGRVKDDFDDVTYYWILGQAINMMLECDMILMLPGWVESNGARTEYGLAEARGMQILHWEDYKEDEEYYHD